MIARREARNSGDTCRSMAPVGEKTFGEGRVLICFWASMSLRHPQRLTKKSASRGNTAGASNDSVKNADYDEALRLFTIVPTSFWCSFSFAVVTQYVMMTILSLIGTKTMLTPAG